MTIASLYKIYFFCPLVTVLLSHGAILHCADNWDPFITCLFFGSKTLWIIVLSPCALWLTSRKRLNTWTEGREGGCSCGINWIDVCTGCSNHLAATISHTVAPLSQPPATDRIITHLQVRNGRQCVWVIHWIFCCPSMTSFPSKQHDRFFNSAVKASSCRRCCDYDSLKRVSLTSLCDEVTRGCPLVLLKYHQNDHLSHNKLTFMSSCVIAFQLCSSIHPPVCGIMIKKRMHQFWPVDIMV